MPHATLEKFGYPASCIAETGEWAVLLRPAQVTLGSLVLAAKSDAMAFGDLPPAAFAELGAVTAGIERMLKAVLAHDRLNYLMLMMVDREVHFHVLPRYAQPREHAGVSHVDAFWPKPPISRMPCRLTKPTVPPCWRACTRPGAAEAREISVSRTPPARI